MFARESRERGLGHGPLRLTRAILAQRRVRDEVEAFLRDVLAALDADAVGPVLDAVERSLDRAAFDHAALAERFQHLVAAMLDGVLFPVRIGRFVEMVLDIRQALVQLRQPGFKLLLAFVELRHCVTSC